MIERPKDLDELAASKTIRVNAELKAFACYAKELEFLLEAERDNRILDCHNISKLQLRIEKAIELHRKDGGDLELELILRGEGA